MLNCLESQSGAGPVRVIVADADPLIGEGLAHSLSQPPWLVAWPSSGPAQAALEAARESYPAVLLISEPLLVGLSDGELALRLDGGRLLPCLVLGSAPDAARALHYLLLGCMGYLSRQDGLETLRRAVTAVAAGEFWTPRAALVSLVRELRDRCDGQPVLTAREREVLSLIHAGRTNADIANLLFISHETVRWHTRRLFSKIGVANRAAAAEFAGRHGVVWRGLPLAPAAPLRPRLQVVSRAV